MMKTNLQIRLRPALTGVLLGAITMLAGCVVHERVAYSSGPYGGAYYEYDYYPDSRVYYYPSGSLYFWSDGGHWISGPRLPRTVVLNHEHREHLRLRTERPWEEHHHRDRD